MFEEYGRVHQINILRDKLTGSHRGKWSNDTRYIRLNLCWIIIRRLRIEEETIGICAIFISHEEFLTAFS
jgi:hypothetical protein